ncbi:hypothetical protein ACNKHM_15540 [Shigella sonnei]
MVGLYQLLYTRIPPHAVLAETVEAQLQLSACNLRDLLTVYYVSSSVRKTSY